MIEAYDKYEFHVVYQKVSQFVAVDESCLMVSPNSGEALQPGTSAFSQSCG